MNTQEMFDKIVTKIHTQGCRSMSSTHGGKQCRYRGDSGNVCAIGAIIKDEFYSEDLEDVGIGDVNVLKAVNSSVGRSIDLHESRLLAELQYEHDEIMDGDSFREDWTDATKYLAEKYNLEYPL